MKFVLGVFLTSFSVAVLVGYNTNTVSGIASLVGVWGIAYMISGTMEGVIRAVFNAIRSLK